MITRYRWLRLIFIALLFFTPLLSTHTSRSQDAAPACPLLAQQVLDDARTLCEGAGRNQACYGHRRLDAQPQPHVSQFNFDEEGDITDIPNIRSLRLSAMQPDSDVWGIALMRIRANAINYAGRQDATMILFGGVEITNGVAPVLQTAELTIHTPAGDARVRNTPWGGTISAVSDGDTVIANGRLANNLWVRIVLPFQPDRYGWIHASLIKNPEAIQTLEVVDRNSALFAPMQAFYFQSGQDSSTCDEVPSSGLLIQTPEGEGRIVFLINEVAVDLGSTVYFQATRAGEMSIAVVEGSAHVQSGDEAAYATAGSQIDVPLNSDGIPAGPPSPPKAYDASKVKALPVQQLDRPIKVAPPLSEDELEDLHAIQDEMAEMTVIKDIMAPEPAPEEAIIPDGDPIGGGPVDDTGLAEPGGGSQTGTETGVGGTSVAPTSQPTVQPTAEPTIVPTTEPTIPPTIPPTVTPNVTPTVEPTAEAAIPVQGFNEQGTPATEIGEDGGPVDTTPTLTPTAPA